MFDTPDGNMLAVWNEFWWAAAAVAACQAVWQIVYLLQLIVAKALFLMYLPMCVHRALVALGIIKGGGDMLAVRRSIAYFLDNMQRQTQQKETVAAIGEDLFAIAVDAPFRRVRPYLG